MNKQVAGDIQAARQELDLAIAQMQATIKLCERIHERVGDMQSIGEIDKLMHASFKEAPIPYSLMALANVMVAIDEDEGGWKGPHLSATLFAMERVQSLADMLAQLGMVSEAVLQDSQEAVSRLMQMLKAPKGRPN